MTDMLQGLMQNDFPLTLNHIRRRMRSCNLGAEVVMTPGTLMRDAVTRATELTKEIPRAVMLEQFKNPANPEAHRRATGPAAHRDRSRPRGVAGPRR